VVLGVSPVSIWEYAWAALPLPTSVPPDAGTRVPNASLQAPGLAVAYRNHAVVCAPRGVELPLSVALVSVTNDVEADATNGARAGVVKLSTAPKLVPTALLAIAQK